jgi:hypothetical protein
VQPSQKKRSSRPSLIGKPSRKVKTLAALFSTRSKYPESLGFLGKTRHIFEMVNLFDKLKRGTKPVKPQAAQPSETPPAVPGEEERGADARRAAERRAEEAGRKWREQAEKNGEIQKEIGGPKGLEPTRYGDWEKAGRCYDF